MGPGDTGQPEDSPWPFLVSVYSFSISTRSPIFKTIIRKSTGDPETIEFPAPKGDNHCIFVSGAGLKGCYVLKKNEANFIRHVKVDADDPEVLSLCRDNCAVTPTRYFVLKVSLQPHDHVTFYSMHLLILETKYSETCL